jgi:hypothetical protein
MEKRTRLGKVVGSYNPPLDGWTYWPEKNWTTREDGFVVVALRARGSSGYVTKPTRF